MDAKTKSALLSLHEQCELFDAYAINRGATRIIRELLDVIEAQDKALSCEWPCKTLVKDVPSVKVYCSSCKTRAEVAERLGRLCDSES